MALCRNPSCKKKHRGEFFCRDCMATLESYVDDLINEIKPESREFYIGRTNYPERRLLEHALFFGRTKLTVLHWAAEWDEIDYLESLFIEKHQGRKSKNQTDEATGKKSGSFNALYISWEKKAKATLENWILEPVTDLEPANRMWPKPFDAHTSTTLHTTLSHEKIEKALQKHYTPETFERMKSRNEKAKLKN